MRIMRRMFTFVVALCFMSSLCLPALADTWDLNEGSVSVGFQDNAQHVTQGSTTKQDSNPVITSNGTATSNTISVSSSEGQTAKITIDNVNIQTNPNTSGIDIANGSTVEMTVSGTNTVDVIKKDNESSGNAAAVHVGNATLTIKGDGNGSNSLSANDQGTYHGTQGAGIGSNGNEDFSGTINITGDVDVKGEGVFYGAGIGSGRSGDFSGTLNITDGATVTGDSAQNGAAIGGGEGGDFSGHIKISDSTVTGTSYNNGAGIGGGYKGDFSGTLEIENSDVRARAGLSDVGGVGGNAAGIGAGYNADFTENASITIKDSTVVATALNRGAGIGAGGNGGGDKQTTFAGELVIDNSNVTAEAIGKGTPVGAPTSDGKFEGSIEITGNSELTLVDSKNENMGDVALIGTNGSTNTGTITIEDSANINAWAGKFDLNQLTDNRDSYQTVLKNTGTYSEVSVSDMEEITNGAEVEVVVVPKAAAAEVPVYRFWDDVEAKIKAADKGDTITIDVKDRTSIPTRILELVAEYGVTLIIQWNGGDDIIVPPDHGVEEDAETILFTELITLLKK